MTTPHLEFSDVSDADQWNPEPLGTVPDHTQTGPADGGSFILDSDTERSGPRMPWERKPRAPKTPGSRKESGDVPALPRNFETQLKDMYVSVGTMLYPIDQVCGKAIVDSAPQCAKTLVDYARTNSDVRRVLLRLVGTTAVGAIIAAHTPIIMAVAMHHVAPLVARSRQGSASAPDPDLNGVVHPFPNAGMN